MEKIIRITCDEEKRLIRIPLDELNAIQGKLKDMSKDSFVKLRNWILKDGYDYPMFVWKELTPVHSKSEAKRIASQQSGSPEGNLIIKWWIIDGHGRKRVLTSLRDEDGYTIPSIPCVPIAANSYVEAKRKVMNLSSQFNKITMEGLVDFMGSDFTISDVKDHELPINMIKFEHFILGEEPPPEPPPPAAKETVTFEVDPNAKKHDCPRCGYKF